MEQALWLAYLFTGTYKIIANLRRKDYDMFNLFSAILCSFCLGHILGGSDKGMTGLEFYLACIFFVLLVVNTVFAVLETKKHA